MASSSRNIAVRTGRWSARHRKTVILGWIVFVVLAFMVGGKVGTQTLTKEETGVGDSGRATKIVAGAYPDKIHEAVFVSSGDLKAGAPRFRAAVDDVAGRLERTEGVTEVSSPYAKGVEDQISADGHTAMIPFEIPGEAEDAGSDATVDATVAAVKAAGEAHPGLIVEQLGDASTEKEFEKIFEQDLQKATTTSLPITLLILLVAFGTMVAAGIPLLLAISGVVATLGLVGPISQIAPVDDSIKHVILLIGLAVGVDYSLFYLRRLREERAAGRGKDAALEAAAATSGRAVLVSGITVMVSMAGMYLAGAATFTSFATGTILVVAVAVLGSLTVLPAVLSLLGDRVDKGRIPGLGRLKRRFGGVGIWSRIVDRVLRRLLLSAVLSAGLLVALALPALHMHTGQPGTDTLPKDVPIVQTYERVQDAFPSETSAAMDVVVTAGDVTAPAVTSAVAELEPVIEARPQLFDAGTGVDVSVNPDKTVETISIGIKGDGSDDLSNRALDALRDDVIPATLGSVDGVQAYVDGPTAQDRDFNDTMKSHIIWVFAFVLSAAFLLLLVTFRSILIPLKAIVLNLLSVGAAYGVMVLVFQHGWGKELLGFEKTGPITAWVPLFLFVVLFGLSTDYHVFILSRVREAYDRGMKTEDAVSYGIKSTAGVVTSAAVVMVAVFAIFGTLSWKMLKQMGVGLAFAVLIDATLVRAVLLPASMKLLGDRNWWLPRSLGWLPKVAPEGEAVPSKA